MKVIILSAGMGKRLNPFTKDLPKGMIRINQTPIIENTLNALLPFKERISEVLIVVGFKKEKIKNYFKNSYFGLPIRYIENMIYENTNNIFSLSLTAHALNDTEDVLLFESDVFFDHSIISELIKKGKTKESYAVVDEYKDWMDGSVITIKDGTIKSLCNAKESSENNCYKTVNIYYFNAHFFKNIFMPMLKIYMQTHSQNHYYEIVLKVIIYLGHFTIKPLIVKGKRWYEIDTPQDLENARFMFKPLKEQEKTINESWGGYWNYRVMDFNFICNAFFPNDRFIEMYKHHLKELMMGYPSARSVINKKLALSMHEDENDIITCNGACECIKLIMQQLKKPLVVTPNFGEYINSPSVTPWHLNPRENFKLNLAALKKCIIKNNHDSVIITNPNNPTSTYINTSEIMGFISELSRNVRVILDVSFMDFVKEKEPLDYKSFKNLVIIKSIGKSYGIPGLRLGYVKSCDHALLRYLDQMMPIWNINSFAEFFLENIHKYEPDIAYSLNSLSYAKKIFIKKLERLKFSGNQIIQVLGSDANFIFCQLDNRLDAKKLSHYLFQKKRVLIKNCSDKIYPPSEDQFLRLNILSDKNNQQLINSLTDYIHHISFSKSVFEKLSFDHLPLSMIRSI